MDQYFLYSLNWTIDHSLQLEKEIWNSIQFHFIVPNIVSHHTAFTVSLQYTSTSSNKTQYNKPHLTQKQCKQITGCSAMIQSFLFFRNLRPTQTSNSDLLILQTDEQKISVICSFQHMLLKVFCLLAKVDVPHTEYTAKSPVSTLHGVKITLKQC